MPLLSDRALRGLKSYKYKAGGYTVLDELHTPFWNWVVSKMPMWLAPNLITLLGTCALVLAYLLGAYYQLDFFGAAPVWVYAFMGVAVVFYTNMDCIDGKQARRTGSSSPLGQLFDHGCDALGVHLMLANIACSLALPTNWLFGFATSMIMLTFVLGQWEEYHTGLMSYGNGYYGILEANYAISTMHFVTTALGGSPFWTELFPYNWPLGIGVVGRNEVLVLVVCVGALIQCGGQLYRGFTFEPAKLAHDERGHKQLGRLAQLYHLLVLALVLVLGSVWVAGTEASVQAGLRRSVQSCWGLTFSLVATQLIMAHMCKEPFLPAWWAIALLGVGAANQAAGWVDAYVAAVSLNALFAVAYLLYVTRAILEICKFLDINCLTIKKKVD